MNLNLNVSKGLGTLKSVVTANSPQLLVGTAIVGIVTTGILAAKGGYKARGIIDEAEAVRAENNNEEPLSNIEKAKLTWPCYAVPAVTGASSIASVVGVHTIHTKRASAMAALYAVTSNKLDDYREKAEELLGPKKTQQVNDHVGQRAVDRRGNPNDNEIILVNDGGELFYDSWSGRYFTSSINKVEAAMNKIHRKMATEDDACLNEFYDHLGIGPVTQGVAFGWSGSAPEVKFSSTLTQDGRPAVEIHFQPEPKQNLGYR